MENRINQKVKIIKEVRPYLNHSSNFLNHTRNVCKLVWESDEAPIELRSIALDTYCNIELELAVRN